MRLFIIEVGSSIQLSYARMAGDYDGLVGQALGRCPISAFRARAALKLIKQRRAEWWPAGSIDQGLPYKLNCTV
jgi:hypothetical protein